MNYPRFAAVALPFALIAVVGLGINSLWCVGGGRGATPRSPAGTASSRPVPAAPRDAKSAFAAIYRDATWGRNADGSGSSGSGSTVAATLIYRTFLQQFLKEHDVHSVVDAGCGDWEFSQAIDWTGIDYKGYDIVEPVIAADKAKYAKENIQFFVGNVVEVALPPADLLISKHVLQHLPTADVLKFLKQIPKYKHVLFTDGVNTVTLTADNVDVVAGGYRELDLLREPFKLAGVKVLTYWDGLHMHQVVHAEPQRGAK